MGSGAVRRGIVASRRTRPRLIKYGQDLPPANWVITNAATVGARPFDGMFLYVGALGESSNGVMSTTARSQAAVAADFGAFNSTSMGNLTHNYPIVRYTTDTPPDYWNDTHWTTIASNWANFAAAVKGANVAGISFDNEYYGTGTSPFDWALGFPEDAGETYGDSGARDPATTPGVGIDPTHNLAQSRAKVQARGKQCMDAVRAVWPDVRVIFLHGPYISYHGTADVLTGVGDYIYWNDTAYANELSGCFFAGFAESCIGTPARVYDGGEAYAVRTLAQIRTFVDWQTRGFPASSTTVLDSTVKASYQQTTRASQGLMDGDEHASPAFSNYQTPASMAEQIVWSMRTHDVSWFYSEWADWMEQAATGWGDSQHEGIDSPQRSGYKAAITAAWNAGRVDGRFVTFGKGAISADTLTATTLAANTRYGSKFTLAEAATITNVGAHLDGLGAGTGSQVAKAAIYAGDGTSTAGALAATSAEVTVTDGQPIGWVDFAFSPVALAAGQWWLMIHTGTNTNTIRLYRDANGTLLGSASDTYADGPAATGGANTMSAGTALIYAFGT